MIRMEEGFRKKTQDEQLKKSNWHDERKKKPQHSC